MALASLNLKAPPLADCCLTSKGKASGVQLIPTVPVDVMITFSAPFVLNDKVSSVPPALIKNLPESLPMNPINSE